MLSSAQAIRAAADRQVRPLRPRLPEAAVAARQHRVRVPRHRQEVRVELARPRHPATAQGLYVDGYGDDVDSSLWD
jgi:hypothetical protein